MGMIEDKVVTLRDFYPLFYVAPTTTEWDQAGQHCQLQ